MCRDVAVATARSWTLATTTTAPTAQRASESPKPPERVPVLITSTETDARFKTTFQSFSNYSTPYNDCANVSVFVHVARTSTTARTSSMRRTARSVATTATASTIRRTPIGLATATSTTPARPTKRVCCHAYLNDLAPLLCRDLLRRLCARLDWRRLRDDRLLPPCRRGRRVRR